MKLNLLPTTGFESETESKSLRGVLRRSHRARGHWRFTFLHSLATPPAIYWTLRGQEEYSIAGSGLAQRAYNKSIEADAIIE